MTHTHISEIDLRDVPAIARLPQPGEAGAESAQRMEAYLRGEHHPQSARAPRQMWVAWHEHTPLGYVSGHLTERFACEGELQKIYVVASHRRQQLGRQLVELLARWFADRDARRICVNVGDENARPFYHALGAIALAPHWMVWEDIREVLKHVPAVLLALVLFGCGAVDKPARTDTATPDVAAPDVLAARVDSVFRDIAHDAPGCAVGVYRNGELVLGKGYGVANVEDGRRITPTTTFDLGSAAKPFTALATLMLEEQRRLSLDDDVRRYVPELPDYGTPIRIRDLLQHTSGLRDYGSLDLLAERGTRTMPEFLALLSRQQRLNMTPGTQHEYSHSDFVLLGVIIERVVKEPFGAYLEREVLRPLGMTNSRVADARGPHVPERAFGHALLADSFRVVFNHTQIVGGGNLYTSVADLQQWDRALAESANGQRPLVARLLTRPTLPNGDTIPYAYGVRKGLTRGLHTISRGGHSNGMRTEFVRFPDQQFGVAVLCNNSNLWAGQRGDRVADVYLEREMQPRTSVAYRPPPAVQLSEPELRQYAGHYHSPDALDHSRIAVRDGRLVELLGDTAQTFTYRGNGEFTGDGIPGDFRLRFSRNTSGVMQMSYVSEGDAELAWERVADSALWRPNTASLSDYVATYFSEELNVVWQLAVANGALVIRRPGRTDGPLQPVQRDAFSRNFGAWNEPLVARFDFARDAAGTITHFSITTPPGEDVVRDLRFVRVR